MPLELSWYEVLLRLGLTLMASCVLGFNRGEQGHPAGLRTTVLVCLAAAASMLQVNLLLILAHEKQSLVTLDLMRLPLGILSGMGFIGGGAILKKGEMVRGVTTAATLWFVTVMGLCFGGGQLVLGLELLALGLFVLWGLKWIEARFVEEQRASLTLVLTAEGPSEAELRKRLAEEHFKVSRCAIHEAPHFGKRRIEVDLRWRAPANFKHTPLIVASLAASAGVARVAWEPK